MCRSSPLTCSPCLYYREEGSSVCLIQIMITHVYVCIQHQAPGSTDTTSSTLQLVIDAVCCRGFMNLFLQIELLRHTCMFTFQERDQGSGAAGQGLVSLHQCYTYSVQYNMLIETSSYSYIMK